MMTTLPPRAMTIVIELTEENELPFDVRIGEYCPSLNGKVTAMSLSDTISEMEILESAMHSHPDDPYKLEEALETAARMHDKSVKLHREAAQKRIQEKVSQDG